MGCISRALFFMRKARRVKTFAAAVPKRVNLANDFYIIQGHSLSNALKHIGGINLDGTV